MDIKNKLRAVLISDIKNLNQMIQGSIDHDETLMLRGCLVQAEKLWEYFFKVETPTAPKQAEQVLN